MRLIIYCLCLSVLFCQTASAQVYRWQDKDGNIHFTDRPKRGATKVKLKPLQSYSPKQFENNGSTYQPPIQKLAKYKKIMIVNPMPNATIRNNDGSVIVFVRSEPPLHPGHRFVLLLDGAQVAGPQRDGQFHLHGVHRGTHTVSAQIVDAQGAHLAQSTASPFHMKRFMVSKPKIL